LVKKRIGWITLLKGGLFPLLWGGLGGPKFLDVSDTIYRLNKKSGIYSKAQFEDY